MLLLVPCSPGVRRSVLQRASTRYWNQPEKGVTSRNKRTYLGVSFCLWVPHPFLWFERDTKRRPEHHASTIGDHCPLQQPQTHFIWPQMLLGNHPKSGWYTQMMSAIPDENASPFSSRLVMENHSPPEKNFARSLLQCPRLEEFFAHKYWHDQERAGSAHPLFTRDICWVGFQRITQ